MEPSRAWSRMSLVACADGIFPFVAAFSHSFPSRCIALGKFSEWLSTYSQRTKQISVISAMGIAETLLSSRGMRSAGEANASISSDMVESKFAYALVLWPKVDCCGRFRKNKGRQGEVLTCVDRKV